MAEASSDANGFIEIKDNKLSKPGVFDYLGSEIGAPNPDQVYKVFRPPEELRDSECVDSFKLQPWVIDHKMVGKKYGTAAESKGVHGVIGENVYFDESDQWLKGNIKMFSDTLEDEIGEGKKELSLGFGCLYDFDQTGVYEGKRYNVVQKHIRGNHLALVDESRMDVAVMDHAMDHMTVTINQPGVSKMDGKSKKPDDGKKVDGTGQDQEITLATMQHTLASINTTLGSLVKATGMDMDKDKKAMDMEKDKKAMDMEKDKKAKGADEDDDDKAMDTDKDKKAMDTDKDKNGMDAAIQKAVDAAVKPIADKLASTEKQLAAMDSSALVQEISKRDELAAKLSHHVGTFDHSSKTLAEVAKYGAEKLGVPCEGGGELAALNAYLHNRPNKPALFSSAPIGQDGKTVASPVDTYLNGGDE